MKAAALFFLWTAVAQAQAGASRLGGTVTDTTGVIGGAQIALKQSGTGFSRAALTDKFGEYLFEELPPGTYSIVASQPGYSTWQADGIALAVSQSGRQDIRLVVGAVGDRITVTAQLSPVQADGASVGYRLDSSQISGIPLDSRNVVELVTLGPGAIPRQLGGFVHDVVNDIQEGSRGAVALNPPINGSRSTDNAFLLDGAYDTDRNTYAIAVYPPMDSVQEFHIQTLLAPAEFPQNGGGAIDVVTKSGTKTLHGSGFEYFDNEAADARNYFDDPTLPRPIFRQNEFGASAGGPVPRLKNTFFYGIYEGLRQKAGNSSVSLVPDAPTRSGDFSGQNIIYDPLTLNPATGTRTPFPGDIIPQDRIDPIASLYLAKYEPLPNSNNPSGNYLDATPNLTTTDAASGRIDHQFANYGLLTGRYTFNGESNIIAGSFPELPTSEQVRAQQAALGYTASSARWVSESRFSFTRLRMFDLPESAFKVNVEQELGLANPDTNPFDFGLPYFNATDYSMVTDSPTLPQVQRDNLWQAAETLALSRGRHALKFGGSFIHPQFNYLQSNNVRGEYDYSGVFTSVDGSGVGSGDPFADFLLGYPQDTTRTGGSGQAYLRQNDYAGFAQDDWRVAPNLTVNLGLRYEYVSPYTEARDNLLNLNYSTLPGDPTLQRVSSAVSPGTHNFAPRAALAWRLPKLPLPGGMTVFRAGYGIYYSQEIAVETYDLVLNGLSNIHNETEGGQLPVLTTRNGFAQTASTGFPSYFGVDPHAPTAYVQQWTAGFQHELPGKLLLETAYIASKGTHLGRFRQFNTPAHVETGQDLPPRPGDLQSLRTFPDLGEIVQRQHIANSSYNSLQVKAEKGMGARLSLLASFVWSKSIDDADTIIPGLFDSVGAQDERNLRLERGLSFSNPGRRISAAYVYRLPGVRAGGGLLKDWSVSGTVTLQDGTPLNPFYFTLDFANSGTPNRPNIVPGQSIALPRSPRTAAEFFNTGAFSAPAPYTFGDAGRDIIPGPGNNIFDLALSRQFHIREHHTVEFRANSFNVFNHPNWGIPGPNPDFGPFFGRIFASGPPRQMQFALRYDF
ncbi:MAG: carboxypeptidase regulatory-like domain-containing protein [Bryobacteraceae bacterium]